MPLEAEQALTHTVTGEIQRDAEIWFEDGNIVVIAQDAAFRFHKGVLSHHSQVFRDLFLVPQPSPGDGMTEIVDDCPVVRVSDTSYDFRELLQAIYGGISYLHPDKTVTFSVLAALARLSHKYQLDELLEATVHRLKRTFTTELEVWDRSGGFELSLSPLKLGYRHAIEALNLFRILDRPEMIPVALYGCCQLPITNLLRGVKRADGVSLESLSAPDLELCLRTKRWLMLKTVHLLSQLCQDLEARVSQAANDAQCVSPFVCVVRLKSLLDKWRNRAAEYVNEDPLSSIYDFTVGQSETTRLMCSTCTRKIKETILQLRREVWASLPDAMDMEVVGWDSS